MDFTTIRKQMEANFYKNAREIYADVRLVFTNAMKYNDDKSDVHVMAKTLKDKFEDKWLQLLPKVIEAVSDFCSFQFHVFRGIYYLGCSNLLQICICYQLCSHTLEQLRIHSMASVTYGVQNCFKSASCFYPNCSNNNS